MSPIHESWNSEARMKAFERSMKMASSSGLAGMLSGVLQVLVFMWLRTVMNVQYAKGGSFPTVLRRLWYAGGIKRLYKGLLFALIQNPATRFGDTAINSGGMEFLNYLLPKTHVIYKTALTALISSAWRVILTPLDMLKTMFQVHGNEVGEILEIRLKSVGIRTFWSGAVPLLLASWMGTYPWFATFNFLDLHLISEHEGIIFPHLRNAFIGLVASIMSDSITNIIRVVKNILQTSEQEGYLPVHVEILKDGMFRFATRGLLTRILINSVQSMFFSVVWKAAEKRISLGGILRQAPKK